jgi:hypothetical protein
MTSGINSYITAKRLPATARLLYPENSLGLPGSADTHTHIQGMAQRSSRGALVFQPQSHNPCTSFEAEACARINMVSFWVPMCSKQDTGPEAGGATREMTADSRSQPSPKFEAAPALTIGFLCTFLEKVFHYFKENFFHKMRSNTPLNLSSTHRLPHLSGIPY